MIINVTSRSILVKKKDRDYLLFCSIDNTAVFNYTRCMKKLLLLALLCVYPALTEGPPGKTDHYGGHMCLKDCEEWKLFYKEYHLHDKDWKPIRISRKTNKTPEPSELRSALTETALPMPDEVSKTTQTVTVYRYVTTVYEESIFSSNPLLRVLLALLMLLLILRLNRKRSENH